jgi:hypothetical protein
VETGVAVVIVALWVLGSMIPTERTMPRLRLCLPYSKEDLRILYRIWATWRVERVTTNRDALTQRFEVLKGTAPYYQTRKMI